MTTIEQQLAAALEPFANACAEYLAGGIYEITVNGRDLIAAREALAAYRSQQAGGGEALNSAGETPTQHAHRWATELAVSLAKKHYPEASAFEPLPDLLGVITQIDNMTTGMVRATQPQASQERKPMTRDQIADLIPDERPSVRMYVDFARLIERAHGIK